MVGHQNDRLQVQHDLHSLGGQGMVGHQNAACARPNLGCKFRWSGNGRPPKHSVQAPVLAMQV